MPTLSSTLEAGEPLRCEGQPRRQIFSTLHDGEPLVSAKHDATGKVSAKSVLSLDPVQRAALIRPDNNGSHKTKQ